MKAQLEDLKKFIKEQEILTRRTILKNAKKNDYNYIKKQLNEFLKKEKDERVKKIIDMRYNGPHNKLTPWRIIAEKLDMSIQGCINIHNRFINKIKLQTKYV